MIMVSWRAKANVFVGRERRITLHSQYREYSGGNAQEQVPRFAEKNSRQTLVTCFIIVVQLL